MEGKKVYETPKLIVHGDIEKITKGSGFNIKDLFVYGISDAIGNCNGTPWDEIRKSCS